MLLLKVDSNTDNSISNNISSIKFILLQLFIISLYIDKEIFKTYILYNKCIFVFHLVI